MKPSTVNSRRFRRLLDNDTEDPMNGVANLFDIALVFVAALLIALVTRLPNSNSHFAAGASAERNSNNGATPREGKELAKFRVGNRTVGGEGQRLGIAYQLPTGEVIYVPEIEAK